MANEIRNSRIAPKSIFRTVGLVLLLSILVARGFPAQVQAANPPHFQASLFGTATQTTFMGYQVIRTDSFDYSTYGGIDFKLPDTQSIPLSSLATLSLDYFALKGGVGGGSPRFEICLTPACTSATDFLTVNFGPPPSFTEPPSSSFENTGNFVSMTSTDTRWQYPAYAYPVLTYMAAYTAAEAAHGGNARVYELYVLIDSGWFFPASNPPFTQTVFFKNIHINNQVFFNHVACPQQGDDNDSKQENHEELCEQKAGHGEQDDSQSEVESQQANQNQQGSDLSGADLNTASFNGFNFSGANLQGADLSGSDLTGVNFVGADLSCANLSNANLSGANLLGAIIEGANLTGANLLGVDLSGVITAGPLVCH